MRLSKHDRFEEFLRRLQQAPEASSHDEAFRLLSDTLNSVEDEFSEIPYHPEQWQTDGRLYPPEEDNARSVVGCSQMIRYRHKGHNTFIGVNGAIEIQNMAGAALFAKIGADGRGLKFHKSDSAGGS